MPIDPMFWLATAAFAWGLSLASYRWFAIHNNWPMGEWQAHRPGLPIAIGLFAMLFAMLFALARGGLTAMVVPILGLVLALIWTAVMRVGAQSALLLAPLAVIGLLAIWMTAASTLSFGTLDDRSSREPSSFTPSQSQGTFAPTPGQGGYYPPSNSQGNPSSASGGPYPGAAPGGSFPTSTSTGGSYTPSGAYPPPMTSGTSSSQDRSPPASTDRDGRAQERDRGITFDQPQILPPAKR